MSDGKELNVNLSLNASKARQEINQLSSDIKNAFKTQGNGFEKELSSVTQLDNKLKQAIKDREALSNAGSKDAEAYARLDSEIVSLTKSLRNAVTDTEQRNKLLEQQLNLEKNISAEKAKQKSGEESFRMGLANGISNVAGRTGIPVVETGLRGILQKTVGGAAGEEGGGLTGASIGALGITGGAIILEKVIGKLGELGQAAQKAAEGLNDSAGTYAKLRETQLNLNYAKDKAGNSQGAKDFQNFSNEIQTRFWGGLDKFINWANDLGKTQEAKNKEALAEKKQHAEGLDFAGEDYKQFQTLKRERQQLEQDLADKRADMETNVGRQRRDLAMQAEEQAAQFRQQQEKIALSIKQEAEKYALEQSKLRADIEFKASEKKYQIEQEAQKRNFNQKQSDEKQDFANKQADEKQALENRKKDEAQEFQNKQADKALDFANKQSDKAQDFATASKRRSEDANEDLIGLQISGGSFSQYFMAARRVAKEQSRATEDYEKEKSRDVRDYQQEQYTSKRDYQFNQSKENRDYRFNQFKENRDFANKENREGRDFKQSMADKAKEHEIDVSLHYQQVKQQEVELELQHNQFLESTNLELKQLSQNAAMASKRLAVQAQDIETDYKKEQRDYNKEASRQRLSQSQAEGDFAEKVMQDHPAEFVDLATKNRGLADMFNQGQKDRGENWGFDQNKIDQQQKEAQAEYAKEAKGSNSGTFSSNDWSGDSGTPAINVAPYIGGYGMAYGGGYATGGYIDKNQIAQLHAGEYVINPSKPDNLGLAMKALGSFNSTNLGNYINTPDYQKIMKYLDGGNIQRGQAANQSFNFSFDGHNVSLPGMSGQDLQRVQMMLQDYHTRVVAPTVQNIVGGAIGMNNQNTYRSASIG